MSKIPGTLWAQRKDCIYLTVDLADCKNPQIDLDEEGKIKFVGVGGTTQETYELELEFYGPINKEDSKIQFGQRNIFLVIKKKEEGPHWPRLLKASGKAPHFLKTDFNLWKDEDEEDEEADGFDLSSMDAMANFAGGPDEDEADSDDEDLPDLEDGPAPTPTTE
ncbi:hypothetical protein CYMTET_18546 [Cymbomonas tetramitiformis]|uniref:CS domain-containing protein n=1 Tax=Cymbomonas tetramitiformis TaxID=36881 RepID=A0AAE0G7U4_9CHLO|nr:hypothetical protein CYMTET_18546 [Cymbomonas tetramitiformis]